MYICVIFISIFIMGNLHSMDQGLVPPNSMDKACPVPPPNSPVPGAVIDTNGVETEKRRHPAVPCLKLGSSVTSSTSLQTGEAENTVSKSPASLPRVASFRSLSAESLSSRSGSSGSPTARASEPIVSAEPPSQMPLTARPDGQVTREKSKRLSLPRGEVVPGQRAMVVLYALSKNAQNQLMAQAEQLRKAIEDERAKGDKADKDTLNALSNQLREKELALALNYKALASDLKYEKEPGSPSQRLRASQKEAINSARERASSDVMKALVSSTLSDGD